MRRVLLRVIDGLGGLVQFGVRAEGQSAVRVSVEAGEVTAGDFNAYPMFRFDDIAGDPQVNLVFFDGAR